MYNAYVAGVNWRHNRGAEQFAVADGGKVKVQNDGVVDSKTHEDSNQVVLPQISLLVGAKPVAP